MRLQAVRCSDDPHPDRPHTGNAAAAAAGCVDELAPHDDTQTAQTPPPLPSPVPATLMREEEEDPEWGEAGARAENNRLLHIQVQRDGQRRDGGGGVRRLVGQSSGAASACLRPLRRVLLGWRHSPSDSFRRSPLCGPCPPSASSLSALRACCWSRRRRLLLVLLCALSLFLVVLQLVYLSTGVICSGRGTIYADRSMDARFFAVGRLRQDQLRAVLLQGLTQIGDIFQRANITDWLDSGMLLGYYRDPATGWIPWDTDADVMVAVRHVPQLLQLDDQWARETGGMDTDTWFLFTQQYSDAVHGAWRHSRHCIFHLVHRATGARIEVWTGPVVPTAAELVHPDAALLCPEEWAADWKNSGRPADLLFPLAVVQLTPDVRVQVPRLDTLAQYLEAVLPGSTRGPPLQRQLLCQDASGASDAWWNRQLLPDFAYQWVWRWRTADTLREGRQALQRDRQWEQEQNEAQMHDQTGVVAAPSAVASLAGVSIASLDRGASFLSSRGYFYGMCVGLLQLEESSPAGRRVARRFLQEATQLPWARAIQHVRRAGGSGKKDAHEPETMITPHSTARHGAD